MTALIRAKGRLLSLTEHVAKAGQRVTSARERALLASRDLDFETQRLVKLVELTEDLVKYTARLTEPGCVPEDTQREVDALLDQLFGVPDDDERRGAGEADSDEAGDDGQAEGGGE